MMARIGATGARPSPGELARIFAAGVLILYAAIVAPALLFWTTPVTQSSLTNTALLAASVFATAACFWSARKLPRPLNLPWLLFGLGAASAMFGVTSYVFFAAGLVAIIQQSEGSRWGELAMDVVLVAAAATVLMLRWAPGIRELSASTAPATFFLVSFGPIAAICATLFVIVVLATPSDALPRATSYSLAAATIGLGLTTLPQVLRGTPCCNTAPTDTVAAIGTWVFLAFAASSALHFGHKGVIAAHGERLRQFVAPMVAIVLAAIALDASIHSTLDRRTAIALSMLAALVALRLTQLLRATETQVAERRELAHTRALIEVSRALAGANNLDTTLRSVTEWAQRVLNARAAIIELLSSDRTVLEVRAASGMPGEVIGLTFQVDSSFTGQVVRDGEARVAAHADRDPLITGRSAELLGDAPVAAVPLFYRDRMLGVITCVGTQHFTAPDLELLRAFANQAAVALEDARLFEQVRALSVTDPLTGLANRRRLDRELQREFAAAKRGRQLVAVMFDLDDFKLHNDRYGHLAGDRALKHFAEALSVTTRAMNLAARYGGDEFFALLADSDRAGAIIFVDRVIKLFDRVMRESGNPTLKVSAGVAEYKADMNSPLELIEAADRALYISKSEGNASK
ncbi:MAG TPA: sensor domain-containing diguanylate cyclase [Longimicrobiales bacterium]